MHAIPPASRHLGRKFLTVAALVAAVALSACGHPVERANLGRCTNLPNAGGALCEEVGGDYIFVDGLTGSMRRYNATQAELIARASASMAYAQASNAQAQSSGLGAGQRNCLDNPGIACSGSLNNRMSTSRSPGFTAVCSGGTCLSAGR